MLELIFQGFMEWAYGLALECWEYFSSSLLDIMSMDYAYMKSHVPVMVSIAQVLLAVGWALLIGNLVFQALKSMAVGLGFEVEDPKLLFTRTFVFAFLLMASPQICEVGLSLTARIIELLEIPDAINVTLVDEGVFGSLGAAWLLVIIFGLIIMLKVFRLLLEIAERYVILAVLTMTAPLAFAMGGSKSTSEIFGGWCRMFGSMCTLMVTNVIFFKMLLSVLSNVPSGLDIIPWIVLVLTIVKVARKADAIITRIGLNPAITGDSLGRGFPGTLTYLVMRSATSHITKAIGKSTGKGNRGAASGSTTGGPRIGGGPSGAHNAAGHTASYQAYQATQQQNTSQGVDGQGFVSQRESVQSGGAQTATQEHFSNSSIEAKESPVTMSYSGDVKTYVNSSDWTGLHYMVRTVTGGYYKASGTFTLPSVNLKSSLSDPDVPYGFFGIYVGDKIGLDLGTYYSQKDGEWGFDISGYIKNSAGEYAHYWRPSSIKYSPSQLSSVNLVATITKGSAYDTVTLKIINGVSWAVIDTITLNTNETGHNATFTKPVNGASESYVTSNYTNLYFNREVCLAYDKQSNRAPTGTTILNARWSQVYLYTPSNGYGLWGTAATTFAHKTAQTSTLANKVSVSITTKWSEDTTNILYQ